MYRAGIPSFPLLLGLVIRRLKICSGSGGAQIAYLTNCLATDLLAKLQFGVCGTMAVALLFINQDYKERNPLTIRRLQFSRCKQGKAETYSDYIVRLEAAHKEADVAIMSPEDIMCLQMLTGCQDSEL